MTSASSVYCIALLLLGADAGNANRIELSDVYSLMETDFAVTSATKTAVRVDDAPAVVTVLSQGTLLARGYRSVGEALTGVPGLFGINNLVTENLGVRGLMGGVNSYSTIIKFMVNGAPVTYEVTGGALLGPEFIPINAVDRIEIIRGPGSALYGANAYLGVVNVVTKEPEAGKAMTLGGELGLVRNRLAWAAEAHVQVRGEGDRPATFMGSFYTERQDRSGLASTPRAQAPYGGRVTQGDVSAPMSGILRATLPTSVTGEWTAQLLYQGLDAFNNFSSVYPMSNLTHLVQSSWVGRLENRLSFLDDLLSFHSFVGFSRGADEPRQRLTRGDPQFRIVRARQDVAIQAGTEAMLLLQDSSVLVGMDYFTSTYLGDALYYEQTNLAPSPGNRPLASPALRQRFDNAAVYAQGILRVIPDWSLTAGLRYDHPSRYDGNLSWRAGLNYSHEVWHAKLLYGTSYVPPTPLQMFQVPLASGDIKGSQTVQPQTAGSLELSGSYQPMPGLSLQLNGYWTRADRRIEYIATGDFASAANLTQSDSLGGEFAVEARQSFWFAQGNMSYVYTLVDAIRQPPSWFSLVYGDDRVDTSLLPGFPAVMGHVTAGVTFPEYFVEAAATVNAYGRRGGASVNVIGLHQSYFLEPYATVDLNVRTVGVSIADSVGVNLSLHVSNLFDTRYTEAGNGFGVDIPALGRCLFLRLRLVT